MDDGRLKLSDDQRSKLKTIDDELAGKLAYLDSVLRNTGSGTPTAKEGSRGGIGFSASSGRTGQDTAKISTPEGGNGGGLSPAAAAENAAIARRVPEVRAHDVRNAIAQALALLDAEQKKVARQVLVERGVDPDTGHFEAKGEPGAGGRDPVK